MSIITKLNRFSIFLLFFFSFFKYLPILVSFGQYKVCNRRNCLFESIIRTHRCVRNRLLYPLLIQYRAYIWKTHCVTCRLRIDTSNFISFPSGTNIMRTSKTMIMSSAQAHSNRNSMMTIIIMFPSNGESTRKMLRKRFYLNFLLMNENILCFDFFFSCIALGFVSFRWELGRANAP